MSKLDEIKPTGHGGKYRVELSIEGEWLVLALLTKEQIIKVSECIDKIMEDE